jgi:uncharacterized membrane protein
MEGIIMTEFVFSLLESIGFHHPLHPVVAHLPMGMIMGMFLFGLASYFLQKPELAKTAYHCSVLALIGVFPTILFGYMDWQHSYNGEWLFPIKIKIFFAVILLILLTLSVKIGFNEKRMSTQRLILYILCMGTATGLGFFGGKLIFG